MKTSLCFATIIIALMFTGCTEEPDNEHIVVNDKIIDGGDLGSIMDPVWISVSIYDGPKQYNSDKAAFSKAQQFVFSVHWYFIEVNNGGHSQFYWNSTGIVWEEALQGLEEIGLKNIHQVLKKSIERFEGNPSKERAIRQGQSEEIDFDDLDDQFYGYEEKIDDIELVLIQYIQQNRQAFFFNGVVDRKY